MDIASGLNLTAAAFSALGAMGAWAAAERSLKSSREAAAATADLTAIERGRRHSELTPEFTVTLTEGWQGIPDNGQVDVELIGPPGLDYLDEVVVTILDEAWRDHPCPPSYPKDQFAQFVWGPWEFTTAARHQVADERTSTPHRFSRITGKNLLRLPIQRTRPGSWMGDRSVESWRREQPGPFRVLLTCHRAPYEPWYLLHEIPCQPPTP